MRKLSEVQLARLGGNADFDVTQHPQYLQAKAQVDEAQRQLDHTVVRAPFDGVATQVDALQPGTYLVAQTAALTNTGAVALVATNDVWVDANMKETDLTHVKTGDKVKVWVDSYPGHVLVRHRGEHRSRRRLGILDPAGAELERQLGEGGPAHSGAGSHRSEVGKASAARRHERHGRDRYRPSPHASELF